MKTLSILLAVTFCPAVHGQIGDPIVFNDSIASTHMTVATDVDLDGDADAVVVDLGLRRLRWFQSQGAGAFSGPQSIALESTTVRSLRAVDLDQDGDEDLIATRDGVPGWYQNLGGSFAAFVELQAQHPAADSIQAADMDGDSILDLVIYKPSSTSGIFWYEGLGGTTFAAPVSLLPAQTVVTTAQPHDLDSDGDVDLVYTTAALNAFVCVRNDGAWPASERVVVAGGLFDFARQFRVGDIDGNGSLDIVYSTNFDERVLLNQGGLSFSTSSRLPDVNAPQSQILIDTDLDGDLDLFSVGDGANRSYWRENVNGVFANRIALPSGVYFLVSAAIGDYDGDGWPDLLATTSFGEGGWLRNRGTLGAGFLDDISPFTFPVQSLTASVSCDIDSDGDQDLVVQERENQSTTVVRILTLFRNDGAGGMVREVLMRDARLVEVPPYAADLDDDGALDLILLGTSKEVLVAFGIGGGAFEPLVEFDWSATILANKLVDPSDIDGDGVIDLVIQGRAFGGAPYTVAWCRGDGARGFAAPVVIMESNVIIRGTTLADLDRDGAPDLITEKNGLQDIVVQFGIPGGGFAAPTPLPGSGATMAFAVGDIDGDLDLDIVQTSFAVGQGLLIHKLDGGSFLPPMALPGPDTTNLPLIMDVDGDGDVDIVATVFTWVTGSATLYDLYFYEQVAGQSFAPAVLLAADTPDLTQIFSADQDRDGDEDLVWTSRVYGQAGWFKGDALGAIGVPYCSNAIPNSTGAPGQLRAGGSDSPAVNALTLAAFDLPAGKFGFFVGSQDQGSVLPVPNSIGRLCLGGSIARFTGTGQVASSGLSGQFFVDIDLTSIPSPTGVVAAVPGETWNFQAWHRDTVAGTATSNFTTAVSILMR